MKKINNKTLDLFERYCKLRNSFIWINADKYECIISEMREDHIKNTIVHLLRHQEEYTKYQLGDYVYGENQISAKEWVVVFRNELAFRNGKK